MPAWAASPPSIQQAAARRQGVRAAGDAQVSEWSANETSCAVAPRATLARLRDRTAILGWCEQSLASFPWNTYSAHPHNIEGGATSLARQGQPQRCRRRGKRGRGAGAAAPAALVDRNRGPGTNEPWGGQKIASRSEPFLHPLRRQTKQPGVE